MAGGGRAEDPLVMDAVLSRGGSRSRLEKRCQRAASTLFCDLRDALLRCHALERFGSDTGENGDAFLYRREGFHECRAFRSIIALDCRRIFQTPMRRYRF